MCDLLKYAVIDGGASTEVATTHNHPEIYGDPLWSARLISTDPECLKKVHLSFLEAGADIIETVTYQATVEGFKKHLSLSEEDAVGLVKKGAEIACQTRDEFWERIQKTDHNRVRPLVAGSMGPYGAGQADASEYNGNYVSDITAEELKSYHRPTMRALLAGGVDLVAMDTVPATEEAVAVAELMEEFSGVRGWIAFSCQDGHHTCHGELFSDAVTALLPYKHIIGVGVNCTAAEYAQSLLESVSEEVRREKIIVVYPNTGRWLDKEVPDESKATPVSEYTARWVKAGGRWIGGCCHFTPADISEIRKTMTELKLVP